MTHQKALYSTTNNPGRQQMTSAEPQPATPRGGFLESVFKKSPQLTAIVKNPQTFTQFNGVTFTPNQASEGYTAKGDPTVIMLLIGHLAVTGTLVYVK